MDTAAQQLTITNKHYGSSVHLAGPQLLQSIRTIEEFIGIFPPGKMKEELWQFACIFLEKTHETCWTSLDRSNVYGMYTMLSKLCCSMEYIATELGPLLKPGE